MKILLFFLAVFFSCLSTCMMSYLAMSTQLGPWVAPVFVVVCMVLAMPLVSRDWFKKYVIVTIAAGSVGGMVGTCLGLTWPSFYFLHKHAFTETMHSPILFAGGIALFVLSAGILAFLMAYFFKDYLIIERKLPFPMSKLIHDIVYIDDARSSQVMMAQGLLASSAWNIFLWAQQVLLRPYAVQLHMMPMLISIGFVVGKLSAISVLIGMVLRKLVLYGLKNQYFIELSDKGFVVTLCSGMFLSLIVYQIVLYFVSSREKKYYSFAMSSFFLSMVRFFHSGFRRILLVGSIALSSIFLHSWHVLWITQIYMFIVLLLVAYYLSVIVGKIGVVDLTVFIWLIVSPLAYVLSGNELIGIVSVAVFSMLCLGLVIDLLFSYKLAELSHIAYARILKYQVLGFLVAVMSAGFIVWWYMDTLHLGSSNLLAQSAQDFDMMIRFGRYDHRVVILGFVLGLIIRRFIEGPLVVIGSILMPTTVTVWLVIAGALSYFVQKGERFYPFWFGVYASHALWIMILAFK